MPYRGGPARGINSRRGSWMLGLAVHFIRGDGVGAGGIAGAPSGATATVPPPLLERPERLVRAQDGVLRALRVRLAGNGLSQGISLLNEPLHVRSWVMDPEATINCGRCGRIIAGRAENCMCGGQVCDGWLDS